MALDEDAEMSIDAENGPMVDISTGDDADVDDGSYAGDHPAAELVLTDDEIF